MRLAGGVIPPCTPPWAGPQERDLIPSKEGQGSLPAAPASLRSLLYHMRPGELSPHPQSLVNHGLPTVYRLNAWLRAPDSVWWQPMLCHRPQEVLQGSASAGTAKRHVEGKPGGRASASLLHMGLDRLQDTVAPSQPMPRALGILAQVPSLCLQGMGMLWASPLHPLQEARQGPAQYLLQKCLHQAPSRSLPTAALPAAAS